MRLRHFSYIISIYYIFGLFLLLNSPVSFARTEISSTNLEFACPAFPQLQEPVYELRGDLNTAYSLKYYSFSQSPAPSIIAVKDAWQFFLLQAQPLLAREFGSDALPKTINVVASDEIKTAGLFCASAQTDPQAVTIYIDSEVGFIPEALASVIAHEFVHFYFYERNLKTPGWQEPLWFEEGLALHTQYLITGHLNGAAVITHLQTPWVSLSDGFNDSKSTLSAYGHAQLLFLYLSQELPESSAGQAGQLLSPDLIKNILATNLTGIASLEKLIQNTPNSPWKNFNEAFRDFEIAKRVNRIDYMAELTKQNLYFIFSTTLRAADMSNEQSRTEETNSHQFGGLSSKVIPLSSINKKVSRCYVVANSLTEPVNVAPCSKYDGDPKDKFAIEIRSP